MKVTHQIGEFVIDLTQIKSIQHTVRYGGEKDKNRIRITYKYMITKQADGEDYQENAIEDFFFANEQITTSEFVDLKKAWEEFIRSQVS